VLLKHEAHIDEPGRVGYFIAVHRERREALFSFRGSATISDFVTDALGSATQSPTYTGDTRFHEGILAAARSTLPQVEFWIKRLFLLADYKVIFCGHSLGGAVASLLGHLLHLSLPSIKGRLHVWGYGTPSCMDLEAAKSCTEYTTNVVLHGDLVPRLSVPNFRVVTRILQKLEAAVSNSPNLSIPDGWVSSIAAVLKINSLDQPVMSLDLITHNAVALQKTEHKTRPKERALTVPGNVVFIWRRSAPSEAENTLVARCGPGSGMRALSFILFEKGAVSDHLVASYSKNLATLLSEFRKDHGKNTTGENKQLS